MAGGVYCRLPSGPVWVDFVCVCESMCLCCFPHGCHVMWLNPRVMCGSLDCVCLGARISRCTVFVHVFLCVMWVNPWVFSLKRWYVSLGNIIHLFSCSSTLTCTYPLDFTVFLLASSSLLLSFSLPVSSYSSSSVVWQIKAFCLLHCGFRNIWTTPSAFLPIYHLPISLDWCVKQR